MSRNRISKTAEWVPENTSAVPVAKTLRKFSPTTFRKWQKEVLAFLPSRMRAIINAPPGAGKTSVVRAEQLRLYQTDPTSYSLAIVPQNNIANGFCSALDISLDDKALEWSYVPERLRFFGEYNDDSTATLLYEWLEQMQRPSSYLFNDRNAVATHQTLCRMVARYGWSHVKHLFQRINLFVDEAHHCAQTKTDANRLGKVVEQIASVPTNRIVLITATYFRGDRLPILHGKLASEFEANTYMLPLDVHFRENMRYLKGLRDSIILYDGDYFTGIADVLKDVKPTDCVLWLLPWPTSQTAAATGLDKIRQSERLKTMIEQTRGHGACVVNLVPEKLQASGVEFLENEATVNEVTDIIALRIGKEGFNFPRLSKLVIIGNRNSLTDLFQMRGRIIRDYEGKEVAETIWLLPRPVASDEPQFYEELESLTKAIILVSLGIRLANPEQKRLVQQRKLSRPNTAFLTAMYNRVVAPEFRKLYAGLDIDAIETDFYGDLSVLMTDKEWTEYRTAYESNGERARKEYIELARSGAPRPSQLTPAGRRLQHFLSRYPEFDNELRMLRPDWFRFKYVSSDFQLEMLTIAKRGEPRPPANTFVGARLCRELKKHPAFSSELKLLRQDWFKIHSSNGTMMNRLIALTKSDATKPANKNLWRILAWPSIGSPKYRLIVEEIRKCHAAWFVNSGEQRRRRVETNKTKLLTMLKRGERPLPGSTLYNMFYKYTNKNSHSYNAAFDPFARRRTYARH